MGCAASAAPHCNRVDGVHCKHCPNLQCCPTLQALPHTATAWMGCAASTAPHCNRVDGVRCKHCPNLQCCPTLQALPHTASAAPHCNRVDGVRCKHCPTLQALPHTATTRQVSTEYAARHPRRAVCQVRLPLASLRHNQATTLVAFTPWHARCHAARTSAHGIKKRSASDVDRATCGDGIDGAGDGNGDGDGVTVASATEGEGDAAAAMAVAAVVAAAAAAAEAVANARIASCPGAPTSGEPAKSVGVAPPLTVPAAAAAAAAAPKLICMNGDVGTGAGTCG
eukprot:364141-Chlamydomonas_euryale.AAC.3